MALFIGQGERMVELQLPLSVSENISVLYSKYEIYDAVLCWQMLVCNVLHLP